ncbi:MAG: SMC-Scp complex subunit ScpB [Candidatus Saganbacteria bacterium]|nr:SMC-Scp complex subunit ScpB [Candidatus Saganbacteria bacterium]
MLQDVLGFDLTKYKKAIESLLFVSAEIMPLEDLSNLVGIEEPLVEKIVKELQDEYKDRGINLCHVAGGFQFRTNPEKVEYVTRFLEGPEEVRLFPASLETLSIIAYKQPCTHAQVENIRGVNSDSAFDTLTKRGFIEEAGRSHALGHPMLYRTTEEFLKHFGLSSIYDLPQLSFEKKEELPGTIANFPPEQIEMQNEYNRSTTSPGL